MSMGVGWGGWEQEADYRGGSSALDFLLPTPQYKPDTGLQDKTEAQVEGVGTSRQRPQGERWERLEVGADGTQDNPTKPEIVA